MAVTQAQLDELWDFTDTADSERRLRAAASAAADAVDRAELETQVARALGLQERFAEADAILDAIPADAAGAAPVRVRIALERGRLRNSEGHPEASLPLFREAAAIAVGPDLAFLRLDALHMLAIADPAHAEDWTWRAYAVLEGVHDPRTLRWNVALHNNAGWALLDAGRAAEALAEFAQAKDAATRWGTPQHVQWADEAIAEARAALPRLPRR